MGLTRLYKRFSRCAPVVGRRAEIGAHPGGLDGQIDRQTDGRREAQPGWAPQPKPHPRRGKATLGLSPGKGPDGTNPVSHTLSPAQKSGSVEFLGCTLDMLRGTLALPRSETLSLPLWVINGASENPMWLPVWLWVFKARLHFVHTQRHSCLATLPGSFCS